MYFAREKLGFDNPMSHCFVVQLVRMVNLLASLWTQGVKYFLFCIPYTSNQKQQSKLHFIGQVLNE